MTWVGSLGSQGQGTGGDRGGVRSRRKASRASTAPPTHPQLLASGSQGTHLWFFKPLNAWSFITAATGTNTVTSFHLPSPRSASLEPGAHVGLPPSSRSHSRPALNLGTAPSCTCSVRVPWPPGSGGPRGPAKGQQSRSRRWRGRGQEDGWALSPNPSVLEFRP